MEQCTFFFSLQRDLFGWGYPKKIFLHESLFFARPFARPIACKSCNGSDFLIFSPFPWTQNPLFSVSTNPPEGFFWALAFFLKGKSDRTRILGAECNNFPHTHFKLTSSNRIPSSTHTVSPHDFCVKSKVRQIRARLNIPSSTFPSFFSRAGRIHSPRTLQRDVVFPNSSSSSSSTPIIIAGLREGRKRKKRPPINMREKKNLGLMQKHRANCLYSFPSLLSLCMAFFISSLFFVFFLATHVLL